MTVLHDEFKKMLDEVSAIRAKNNLNWMAILELAHRGFPEETEELIKEVTKCDQQISEALGGKLK